jgi:Icc-related predicted phosphoesterase
MLIYAVADIHGKRKKLIGIKKNIDKHQPDALVVAGDITNYFQPVDTINFLNILPVPVLTVRGNSDFPVVDKLILNSSNIHSIHGKAYLKNDFHFIGQGGAIPFPFRTKVCFREKKKFREIAISLTDKSILVMHPPPFGVLDRVLGRIHTGSRNIYEIITQKQPMLFLCGHIHEDIGNSVIGKTVVVNCSIGKSGDGAMIQLHANKIPKVEFLRE